MTDPEEESALLRSVSLPQSKGLQNLRGLLRLELQEQPMLQHADPRGEAEEQQRGALQKSHRLENALFYSTSGGQTRWGSSRSVGGVASQKHKLPSNDDPAIREKAIS